eukprot:10480137-Alexandrium_andersonii.AAC.1
MVERGGGRTETPKRKPRILNPSVVPEAIWRCAMSGATWECGTVGANNQPDSLRATCERCVLSRRRAERTRETHATPILNTRGVALARY